MGPGILKKSESEVLKVWLIYKSSLLNHSLRTQTYFPPVTGSAENNVCEPEPENDFCDVKTFVFSLANQIAW